MTPEAALTKMSYLLGRSDIDLATKRRVCFSFFKNLSINLHNISDSFTSAYT